MRPWPHMLSGTKQPTWFSETWKFCSNKFFANRLKNTILNPFWSLLSFVLYFLGKIVWSYFFSHFIKIFLDAFIICFEQMVNLYICVVARVSSLIYILSWYMKISSYFTIKKLAFSLLICKLNLIFILNLSCSLIIFSNINLKLANLKDGELCNCQRSFVWKYSRLEILNQIMKQRKKFKATQCIKSIML